MCGFVAVAHYVAVGLRGRVAVSLMCWAVWPSV